MSELLQRPETMVDVYRLLPEGTPIEVIGNQFYISPAPNLSHFNIVDAIVDELKKIVSKEHVGRVFFAPVDVFLGDKNAIQPDIFFIRNQNLQIIQEEGIFGAPDIIIEVLSRENKNADLINKKAVYEEFGVNEYFIINPVDKEVIIYYLEDRKYTPAPAKRGKLISRLLDIEINF